MEFFKSNNKEEQFLMAIQVQRRELDLQHRVRVKMKLMRRGMLQIARRGGYGVILQFDDEDQENGVWNAVEKKLNRAGFATLMQAHAGGPRMQVFWQAPSAS